MNRKKLEKVQRELNADKILHNKMKEVKARILGLIGKLFIYFLIPAIIVFWLVLAGAGETGVFEDIKILSDLAAWVVKTTDWMMWVMFFIVLCWWFGVAEFELNLREKPFYVMFDYLESKDEEYNDAHTYDEFAIVGNRIEVHRRESHLNMAGWFKILCGILAPIIFPIDAILTIIFTSIRYLALKIKMRKKLKQNK